MRNRFASLKHSPMRRKLRREGALQRRLDDVKYWRAVLPPEGADNPEFSRELVLLKIKRAEEDVAHLKQKLRIS